MSKPHRAQIRPPTLRESLLALVVGVVVAVGPLTPAAWGPSIAAGVIAAALALWWQASRRAKQGEAPEKVARQARWQLPFSVWLCVALFAAAGAPTFAWMYSEWTGGVWHNTHGLLIPILMVMLGRNILRRMPACEDTPSAWGWLLVLPGLGLLVVDAAIQTRYLSAMGIVVCLPGLSLLLLGPLRTRALALPLSLGVFMIPLPNAFASQMYLRTFTAEVTAPLLTAMGTPTLVDHTLLELPDASFLVANSCSGFSTLYSALAMGILLGTLCPSVPRRWLVYASIVPLALAANVARVVVLVLLAVYVDPSLLDTSAHAASGVATFFVVLVVLIGLADRPPLAEALLLTRFSARFAVPLAIALALATAAVFSLRAAPPRDECASPEALLDANAFEPPLELVEEGMRATRIERGRLTALWTSPRRGQYSVAIVRSHGLPNLLLQPPIALPGRNEADDLQGGTLETDSGRIPIHYAYERRGREVRVTAYLLAYRGTAVEDPIWTRLREGPSAVFAGTWPITVFAAAAHAHVSQIEESRAELDVWLARAWSHYQQVCGS